MEKAHLWNYQCPNPCSRQLYVPLNRQMPALKIAMHIANEGHYTEIGISWNICHIFQILFIATDVFSLPHAGAACLWCSVVVSNVHKYAEQRAFFCLVRKRSGCVHVCVA